MIRAYVAAIEEREQFCATFQALAHAYRGGGTDPTACRWIRDAMRFGFDCAHDEMHALQYLLFLAIFLTATLTKEANGESWQK